ncbi:MAG: diaminopimelate decarboxylase [Actinomycetota bacterium]
MASPWPSTFVPPSGEEPARLGDVSLTELAAEWGTPAFILDLSHLRTRVGDWVRAASEHFAADRGLAGADVYYASKAFTCVSMVELARDQGLCLDVASGGELAIGLAGRMPGERIALHGNNKSAAEVRTALAHGVGRIVVDSLDEVDLVGGVAADLGVVAPAFLRVTTGIHAGANELISTGHEDQKFGLSIASGAALEAARAIVEHPSLDLIGLHSHIGSQVLDDAAHRLAAEALLRFRAEVAEATGVVVPEVDLGGGFGISYTGEDPLTPGEIMGALAEAVRTTCMELSTAVPRISVEPGRHIIGPAMISLYTVGTIKPATLPDGERWYVSVDGGMSDNIRPVLYAAAYRADLVSRESSAEPRRARLVGKHCESGDILVKDLALPADLRAGDLVALAATGAYGRSMASNYNLLLRPPVLAVADGAVTEWVRRETIDDVLALDPRAGSRAG